MSALVLEKCIFLHVPKTGGTWVRDCFREMGVIVVTINTPEGTSHPTYSEVKAVVNPNLPIIATVRQPIDFLKSFWKFYHRRAWRPGGGSSEGAPTMRPLLELESPTFQEFAAKYCNRRSGYVTELFNLYVDKADHVIKQESLLKDLRGALDICKQPYIPRVFARTKALNKSGKFNTDCAKSIIDDIKEADIQIYEKYYQ